MIDAQSFAGMDGRRLAERWRTMFNGNLPGLTKAQHLAGAFLLTVSCIAPAPAQSAPPLAADLVNVVVEARIDRLLTNPSEQLKVKRAHDEDEQKLETLMHLMAKAFLYDYDGLEGNLVRVKFRPKENYNPPTYEARVVHSLAGTILIDSRQKRLARISGRIISPVEFGYGLLGHIDNGGTVEIGRVEVGPSQWKTALIDVQLSGRLVLFKTISKQEYEIRSDFRAVPDNLSLSQANQLTSSRIMPIAAPETLHTAPEAMQQ